MTKKRRLLSLLLCLCMLLPLFSVLAVPASAAGADEMDASYVVDDLKTMGVDTAKYPRDATDDRVELLKVIEFGYRSNRDFSEYGLYLYLYNPSGKTISEDKSCVQLAYGLNRGGTTSYIKYRLKLLSHSTETDCENVFWKVKIEGAEAIAPLVNQAARVYKISGVEILRPGDSNATDHAYGCGSFTFTGYHKGCYSNDYSTLRCIADKLDVIELELHPTSYFADRAPSNDYQSKGSEVFGVYFSLPKWVIQRYGNEEDDRLRGLVSVEGSYNEVKTNGILTDSAEVSRILNLNRSALYFLSWYFVPAFAGGDTDERYCAYNYPAWDGDSFWSHGAQNYITRLSNLLISKKKTLDGLTAEEFLSAYLDGGKTGPALERISKTYQVTKSDVGSVEQGLSLGSWLKQIFTFGGLSTSETLTFDLLERLSPEELGAWKDETVSENLLVNMAEVEGLRDFTVSQGAKGDTVYLMRFAVRDYEVDRLTTVGTRQGDTYHEVDNVGNSYYFEKTVFEDLDILQMTFRTKENKMSVVPVSASPITVSGGIPAPGQDDPNAIPSNDSFLSTIFKLLAVIAVILLIIAVLWLFGGVSGIFGVIRRVVTDLFRSVKKLFRSGKRDRKRSERSKTKSKKENEP